MKRIGQITQASMQEYKWQFFYNAIFMVWCAGYLEKGELVSFLRKCKTRLVTEGGRISRTNPPYSFIFLMDNIRGEEFTLFQWKGQWVRSVAEYKDIFKEAGLIVHKQSEEMLMPAD